MGQLVTPIPGAVETPVSEVVHRSVAERGTMGISAAAWPYE
jgi:hypothetical protein